MRDKIIETILPVFVNYRGMGKIFFPIPSRVTIWRLEKEGKFPQGIKLSSSCKVWRTQEIIDWVESHEKRVQLEFNKKEETLDSCSKSAGMSA